jgi:dTMP kinase
MNRKGFFLVLEGIDGSGTSTQAELLANFLRQGEMPVLVTREPSDGPVGRFIRQGLRGELTDSQGKPTTLDWKSFALLFSSDRTDHLEREILPALDAGSVVICDRYDLSSLLYQSATSPEGASSLPWLREINARARRPDFTIVLSVDAGVAETRRRARDEQPELFERSELQARLSQMYADGQNFVVRDRLTVLSAEGRIEDVAAAIRMQLCKFPEFAWMRTKSG